MVTACQWIPHWRNVWAAPVRKLQIKMRGPQIQIVHFNPRSQEIQSNGLNQQIFCGGRPLSYLWAVMNHHGSAEASPRFNLLHPILALHVSRYSSILGWPPPTNLALWGPVFWKPRGDPPQRVEVKFRFSLLKKKQLTERETWCNNKLIN